MAFQALRSFRAARFDLSKSGVAANTGATAPMVLGSGRACVHVAPHRSHYRTPSGAPVGSGRAERSQRRRQRHASADVQPLVDSSAAELLTQLNRAYARGPILTALLGVLFTIALVEGAVLGSTMGASIVFGSAALVVVWFVHETENRQYSEPVEYVLDRETAQAYRRLLKAFRRLVASGPVWRIAAQRRASDGRQVMRRRMVTPRLALPPRVVSNIRVPKLRCGRQTLYFFPDRVLVYDAQLVWGVFYHELQIKAGDVREVADLAMADPDTPLNGYVAIATDAGLSEVFRCADPASANELAAALQSMA